MLHIVGDVLHDPFLGFTFMDAFRDFFLILLWPAFERFMGAMLATIGHPIDNDITFPSKFSINQAALVIEICEWNSRILLNRSDDTHHFGLRVMIGLETAS
jgi:hypothetical protein